MGGKNGVGNTNNSSSGLGDVLSTAANLAVPEKALFEQGIKAAGSAVTVVDKYMDALTDEAKGEMQQIKSRIGSASGTGKEAEYNAALDLASNKYLLRRLSPEAQQVLIIALQNANSMSIDAANRASRLITASNKSLSDGGKWEAESSSPIGLLGKTIVGGVGGLLVAGAATGAITTTAAAGTAAIASIAGIAITAPVSVPLLVVGSVVAIGAGILGTHIGVSALARSIGSAVGRSDGLNNGDAILQEKLRKELSLDIWANQLLQIKQSNPTISQEIEGALRLPSLEQSVMDASSENKEQAAKAFITEAMKFEATKSSQAAKFNFNEDHFTVIATLPTKSLRIERFKKLAKISGRDLTDEESRYLDAMVAYGSILQGEQKLGYYALYKEYLENKNSDHPFASLAEKINSKPMTGFSGIWNGIMARIYAFFQDVGESINNSGSNSTEIKKPSQSEKLAKADADKPDFESILQNAGGAPEPKYKTSGIGNVKIIPQNPTYAAQIGLN